MAELNRIVNSRKFTRKKVTETFNKKADFSSYDSGKKALLRKTLNDYSTTLHSLDEKIQTLKWANADDESGLLDELEACNSYDDKIRECLVLLDIASEQTIFTQAKLKNPIAPLPKYTSKDGEDLTKFIFQFEEIVNKYSYSEYEKLVLLRQQVSGRALILIDSLEIQNQSYTQAKLLLEKALAKKDTQQFQTLKIMSEIRLNNNSDPFEYVSKMKQITENISKLGISMEIVMQYFFWNGLNDDFRNELVLITNNTRPTLKQINEHFFTASERYIMKRKLKSEKSASLAVNISIDKNKKYLPCTLCSANENSKPDHTIKDCSVYPTAFTKVEQLRKLRGCTKCAFTNHVSEQCRYKFKDRCTKCYRWHFNFLCIPMQERNAADKSRFDHRTEKTKHKANETTNAKEKPVSNKTNNTLGQVTEALESLVDSETILPTFSCFLEDNSIRCLKDSGCQSNFIVQELADRLNLRTIDENLNVTVNGINVPKNYITRSVEAKLNIGNKEHTIKAICIPNINVCLDIPNLDKVVAGFLDKGYILADDQLINGNNKIENIKLILGTKSGFCIPEKENVFGKENSLFSETPHGVLLKGDVNHLLNDLQYLPLKKKDHLLSITSQNTLCFNSYLSYEAPKQSIDVFDDKGEIIESQLSKATEEIIEECCNHYINKDTYNISESVEVNNKLIKYTFKQTDRADDGRLVMPLSWNSRVKHLLGENYNLAKAILNSLLKRYKDDPDKLQQIDDVFKEQESLGIIEKIENIEEFLAINPNHSFLPYMGIFRPDRESTKCRVVFLSNLCENKSGQRLTMSHNQAIHCGPSLNQKLSSSILHLRFGRLICLFDIRKAFNNISLFEQDQNKLLFLWVKNLSQNNHSFIAYRNLRLPFGLRCSPFILMLGMNIILVQNTENDSEKLRNLKQELYQLSYMDNCAFTGECTDEMVWKYEQLSGIFNPYKFGLQQFVSNDESLQQQIDETTQSVTTELSKFLGLQWNKSRDELYTKAINLRYDASTKREILSSIASQYDLFNYNGPILNRSRIFMHSLQIDKELSWDDPLPEERLREWRNITKQVNAAPCITIPRCVGSKTDKYELIAFSDSSSQIYGTVVYLRNVNNNKVSFLMARNKLVNKQLETKTIPSLELQAMSLATETILDVFNELTGSGCIMPVNIISCTVYTDSLVALSWLSSYSQKLDKMQKRHVFVLNRLENICQMCETHPIIFSFVSGEENPADCITRPMSYKQLIKSNYLTGPTFLSGKSPDTLSRDSLTLTIPNPMVTSANADISGGNKTEYVPAEWGCLVHLVSLDKVSSFSRFVRLHALVLNFVNKLKSKLKTRKPEQYKHLTVFDHNHNFYDEAVKHIIRVDQSIHYPEVFSYFSSGTRTLKSIPNIVKQLNLYLDRSGILRVKSKCEKMKTIPNMNRYNFPMLLSKNSKLVNMIVIELHEKLSHTGIYSVLAEIRKKFWISHIYSVVKKTIRNCVVCKRYNARPIQINQAPYREFRINPAQVPFQNVFIDYIGPFNVKNDKKETVKIWILIVSCNWSRAINMKICHDQSTSEFLRAFQLHCYDYGIPTLCTSDLGTQLIAGTNIIKDFVSDPDTMNYFNEKGVKSIDFNQYHKGRSELGSLVESCVKRVKRLIYSAMHNIILPYHDFVFLIEKTKHLVNRRPISYKESLRDTSGEKMPQVITPEMLIHGRELISVNLIPDLNIIPEEEWTPKDINIASEYSKLYKVRKRLVEAYQNEFMGNLVMQATSHKDRYKPHPHVPLKEGDIVLIKDPITKPNNFPMCFVKKVFKNSQNEVTGALVKKGSNGELLKRHSTTLIPLLISESNREGPVSSTIDSISTNGDLIEARNLPKRKAAIQSEQKTRDMLDIF